MNWIKVAIILAIVLMVGSFVAVLVLEYAEQMGWIAPY